MSFTKSDFFSSTFETKLNQGHKRSKAIQHIETYRQRSYWHNSNTDVAEAIAKKS